MCPLGFDIDGIQRLAGGHEQAVAFFAAKTDIGTDFRQANLADAVAVRGEDVNAIIAFTDPAGRGPDVAVHIRADAVGKAGFAIQFHSGETLGHWPVFCRRRRPRL
ncbi:MAG: hypothetical protein KatS3mg105_0834 [Gemmatales bacterium]|nr:MAG: hypothetical protein KatS3mg105_0834 [Gemmatales bacterium]